MKHLIVVAIFLAGLAEPVESTAAAVHRPVRTAAALHATLCRRDEQPLFICPLGRKSAAVCRRGGSATYRFGRPGHVELQSSALRFAEQAYSGGGEAQIGFSNEEYRYTAFDRTVRTGFGADGRNDPRTTSGIIVQRGDQIKSTMICTGISATGIDTSASKVMPAGTFVRH